MIFLIRLIQNAVNIYSLLLLIYALLSWFPNSYGSSLERLLEKLIKPIVYLYNLEVWIYPFGWQS